MNTGRGSKPFDRSERAHFELLLRERRAALANDVESLEREESGTAGQASGLSIHSAEFGTDRSAHDVSLGCLESVTEEIQEIDEALERLREARFGTCEGCGQRIARERLKAIPYARLCLTCKMAEETL